MRNTFLIVVALGLVLIGVGIVVIGAFPPDPHAHAVQKVLPNDKFQPK